MSQVVWCVADLLSWITDYFQRHDIDNPRFEAEVLLSYALQMTRLMLYTEHEKIVNTEELFLLREWIIRRTNGECVATIVGEKEFMGLPFYVNASVLVPRPDTEILVDAVLESMDETERVEIIDLGTGSGAILLSLLYARPTYRGIGLDISKDALAVAQENASRLGVSDRVEWRNLDLRCAWTSLDEVDVVVSNPPYIPTETIPTLAKEVQHEPVIALDGGADGLDYYRAICANVWQCLRIGGTIALEIGFDQAKAVTALLQETGRYTSPCVVKDYGKRDRVIICKRMK